MKAKFTMEFNWSEIERKNALAQQAAIKATRNVVKRNVFEPSQKLVPVQDGHLKRSGRINPPQYTASGFTITVQYGGNSAPYALFVHDGTIYMEARKFLEKPLLAAAPKLNSEVAKEMSKVWR